MNLFQLQSKFKNFVMLFILYNCANAEKRKLSMTVNPGCDILPCDNSQNPNTFYNLIYVRADGPNDTLHYFWSAIGPFSVLTVLTRPDATFQIDWKKLLSKNNTGSIKCSENPIYSSAVSFTKLWDFIDTDDTASFNDVPSDHKIAYLIEDFQWNNITIQENTDEKVAVDFVLSHENPFTPNSNVTFIKLAAFGIEGRSDVSPRLLFNSNITQAEIIFDSFKTNSSSSRFALEAVLLSSDLSQGNFTFSKTKSLDDEFTPGIFVVTEVVHENSFANKTNGFLQWKPICYTSSDRVLTNSTDVKLILSNQQLNETYFKEELKDSLVNAFYGYDSHIVAQLATVSFGAQEDKFYQHFKFSTWSLNLGYGSLPKDEISLTVILVILIGLGIPFLLTIAGGIYIGVKRYKAKNDDLSFGQ